MKSTSKKTPTKTRLPRGWTEADVRAIIQHYENQTEAEAIAEDEAAFRSPEHTVMVVPNELVPEVRKLLARKRSA